jgi:hypothetical protein
VTAPIERLLRFEIDRTRALYEYAGPGIDMLHPTSRDCIRTAFTLYGGILGAVERAGYQVLTQRVSVPMTRRLAVAVPGMVRAVRARREDRRWRTIPTGVTTAAVGADAQVTAPQHTDDLLAEDLLGGSPFPEDRRPPSPLGPA